MRVLVIRCGALGDLVYATSVIDALILEYGPDVIIDFVCTPSSGALFECDSRIRRVFPLQHKKVPIFLSPQKRAIIRASKKEPYDLLINLELGSQFKALTQKIVAIKKAGVFCEPISITTTKMVEVCKEIYANAVSLENLKKAWPRVIGADLFAPTNNFSLPENFIVLSPSNSHNSTKKINYRAWPHSHWKELIDLFHNDHIIIVGAKGEERFFEPIKPYPKNVINLVGKLKISELVGVISKAQALISTDTGTAHIASAVNTPVFCLIGPTPADQTGPYKTDSNFVTILNANLPCSPCYKTYTMHACQDNLCMKSISPQMVYESVEKFLALKKASS